MQVGILSVQKLFGREVHYAVPLYQRPYVWNEKDQWRPLWEDLSPLAEMVAEGRQGRAHFLGASVQEPIPVPSGETETRRVIDGQQRLTTLQLLLKAFRDAASARGHQPHAQAIGKLLSNDDPLITEAPKRLKLWPTQTDQKDFQRVMDAGSPADLLKALCKPDGSYPLKNHTIANAYLFFHKEIDAWLEEGGDNVEARVKGLYGAIRDQLRLVVIDLDEKDDAQAIFETLNARGAPLLSADLIKNTLLGRLSPVEATEAYRKYWQNFDSDGAFWRELVGRGHAQRARIETFLQHALTLMTGEQVSAGHLYNAFRDYADGPTAGTATDILKRFRKLGDIYRRLQKPQQVKRLDDFYYRLHTLDVVTAWPFILALYERFEEQPDIVQTVLIDLETYLVRRMVCRLSTRGYGAIFTRLTGLVTREQSDVVATVRAALLEGEAEVDRFPRNGEFEKAWTTFRLYEHLTRPRLRFLLEAMEDALRTQFSEETSAPKNLTVEHVMPQGWREHWQLPPDESPETRDNVVQTIGNLTLLNSRFNPYQSNRPWIDGGDPEAGKRANLDKHTVLLMNRELCGHDSWTEANIESRAQNLFDRAKQLWPVPVVSP
jgi:uncharacterized protein with ParB-like and HNH nuclease domain